MITDHDDPATPELQNDSYDGPRDRISGILPVRYGTIEWCARAVSKEASMVVRASSKIRTAVEMLRSLDVRYLPVVNEEGVLVGMLSDRDLRALRIPYFVGNEYVGSLQTVLEMPVARLLNGHFVSVDEGASILEVLSSMLREQVAIVPVTDADGILVGVISYLDVLRLWPMNDTAHAAAAG